MGSERDEEGGVGEQSSVAAGDEPDRTAATTEFLPSMVNQEWDKAGCTDESIQKWTAADVFRPGELIEWRIPTTGETPSPSILEDQFVVLSLNHIMCGLRTDASDFLVRVLEHYDIEWSHLTPNSITALSIFAHLSEAYLGVPPTVEVFAHFYRLYTNNKGETVTLGGVYFRLRDKMRRSYPVYYLKASQFGWTSLWFYAKLPQSCRLTFKGETLKETNNWKDVLLLSPEQEKQVRQIEELSNQGLTGVDIVHDYLKHRISPLRRRAHLSCNYTGPTDPTRDSDKDISEEDIESRLSYLLDLKKTGQKEPPKRPNVPTSLIRASVDRANQPIGLLNVLPTLRAKKKAVDELTAPRTAPRSIRKSSDNDLAPASPRRCTRQSAITRKVPPAPEIDSSEDEEIPEPEARTTITTAASPNRGVEQKSIENPAEIEGGKRVALVKPISSGGKRKFFASPSGSQRKPKYSFISAMAKTRTPSSDTGCMKGTSLRKEAAVALNPQSPGSTRPSPASSMEKGEKRALFILANVVNQNNVAEDSVSNALLDQRVRDDPPKEADPTQSIAERVQHQEAIKESAPIAVPNPEEINSEVIWERMQKVYSEFLSSRETTFSELLEQAKKLVVASKHPNDEHIMLEQQVKDLKGNISLLKDMMTKAKQETLKGIEENTKLKDEIRDQKKMIDELSKQNESTQESLAQKYAEVNHLKEEAAQKCAEVNRLKEEAEGLKKDKEELQSRVSRANELLQLMTSALCQGKGADNRQLPDF
ncbi:uncharacterized protein [Setaria viridis]|uniref:Transposase (putative) gypsy type domain-containing protein n=1 Tax=Setaria viridis TaxID=4556 RepID=A0A4U6TRM9_SETVI|nr:uncharacterized protein LOC117864331 [Setaria viridis]TKW03349.1 hypothetical protein SEVIR_7G018015v2 [Setaria viridis]